MSAPPPLSAGPLQVVIVDDEPAIRILLGAVFARDDRFEIAGLAVDGREAIEQAQQRRPDIILLDLVMPEMSGWEALPGIVRASPQSMVLVLSALGADDEAALTMAIGAFAYLEKSVLGPDLPHEVFTQHQRFARALAGETVWSPSASWRIRR